MTARMKLNSFHYEKRKKKQKKNETNKCLTIRMGMNTEYIMYDFDENQTKMSNSMHHLILYYTIVSFDCDCDDVFFFSSFFFFLHRFSSLSHFLCVKFRFQFSLVCFVLPTNVSVAVVEANVEV